MPTTEKVVDGSFESGALAPNWTTDSGDPSVITYGSTALEQEDESQNGFLLGGSTQTSQVSQEIAISTEEQGLPFILKALLGGVDDEELDTATVQLEFRDAGDAVLPYAPSLGPVISNQELIEKTFAGTIPSTAVKVFVKALLTKGGVATENFAAIDNIRIELTTELEVYTDAYATVAEMDTLLFSNKRWTSMTTERKENYIKQATQIIDDSLMYAGKKLVSSQALKFPRDFTAVGITTVITGNTPDFFSETQQRVQIRKAMQNQVQMLLDITEYGQGDTTDTSKLRHTGRRAVLDPLAFEFLRDYATEWGEIEE